MVLPIDASTLDLADAKSLTSHLIAKVLAGLNISLNLATLHKRGKGTIRYHSHSRAIICN